MKAGMKKGLDRRGWSLLAPWLVCCCLAVPAAADWLVTADGQRIETSGPWQVKGKQVLFTASNGTLSSIRLSEVDLAASEQASRPAAAEPEPSPTPPPPRKKPVLVLTDKDVARAPTAASPEASPAGEGAQAGAPAPGPEREPVVLVDWQQIEKDPALGVEIMGTVRNTSDELVTGVTVNVRLLDGDGELIAEKQASVKPNTLGAGVSTNFLVVFGDVAAFANPSFEIRSTIGARVVGTPPPPAADTR